MNYPEVKYFLINPLKGRYQLIFEPLNWNEDDKKLVRNEDNWGVFTELSNDLQFVKDGKNYITGVYEAQGTEAELILERYVSKETNKGYELDYKGFLDLKTYQLEDEKVSIQFLSGGLQSIIESQFDEAYELERGTDINGNQITALDYDRIYWEGRRIFLQSKLRYDSEISQFIKHVGRIKDFPYVGTTFDTQIEFESDPNVESVSDNNLLSNVTFAEGNQIFYVNDLEKQVNIKINLDLTIAVDSEPSFDQGKPCIGISVFDIAEDDTNLGVPLYTFNRFIPIAVLEGVNQSDTSIYSFENISGQFTKSAYRWISNDEFVENNIDLLENQALKYTFVGIPKEGASFTPAFSTFNFYNSTQTDFIDIILEEDSEREPTTFDGIRLYDAFDRMLEIYTGQKGKVISDYFTNGQFKDALLSSGKQIRQLPDARLSVELKDLYETNNYFNLGWSVEKINQTEYFVVEPKRYFFQNTVAIDLGEVSNLTIRCKSDLLYKSMQFGNKKAGDYEEVQGLQEYNALTTYVSHLKTSDTKYEVAADVRADLVGAELARRKNYSVAPNTDTRYDNENFLFNCKPYETDKFTPKVWQDVLDEEPTVYDPQTAGNLLLTPFRSMQRHSNVFNAGTKVYQDKFTRYSTGSGEVNVITKLENEPPYAENGEIVNSDLETPIFEAIEYQFNRPIDLEINKKLRGKTNVNGRKIPNVNFLVKFAYKGENYTGYISEVSFNGSGEWTLIKNFN